MIPLFAKQIYNIAITGREIINNRPKTRIIGFLKDYKKMIQNENEVMEIPDTRQEIADLTSLRVEIVSRFFTKIIVRKDSRN